MIENQDIVTLPDQADAGAKAWSAFEGLTFDDAISKIANSIVDFGFKLLIALLIFYVGKFVILRIYKFIKSVLVARQVDASLTTFILSLVKIVLYFILLVTIIGILGIETSSFLALFASAGVAIGMALSGTLQNFAGGVLILLLKPYKVGDYIEAGGYTGTVKEIQIFHTVINTNDNKAIIIPNGGLSTGSVNNYSLENYRRVDWNIGLTYGIDFEAARKKIIEMLLQDSRVVVTTVAADKERRRAEFKEHIEEEIAREKEMQAVAESEAEKMGWFSRMIRRPKKQAARLQENLRRQEELAMRTGLNDNVNRAPFVGLNELADSSVNLTIRAWTHSSNYWPLYFEMMERFYRELPEAGFEFPFPQMDVHLFRQEKG